jgi:hypothetical protein
MNESVFVIGFFLFATGAVCGSFASNLADQKGYSAIHWFLAGFFFNIIALIAAAGLPLKRESAPVARMNRAQ